MNDREARRESGELAYAIADHAEKCIGPGGTIVDILEDDAFLLRSAYITRLAEAAMKILDERAN